MPRSSTGPQTPARRARRARPAQGRPLPRVLAGTPASDRRSDAAPDATPDATPDAKPGAISDTLAAILSDLSGLPGAQGCAGAPGPGGDAPAAKADAAHDCEPPGMAPALRAALTAAGHLPPRAAVTPLTGGRSNRLWRVAGPGEDRVVKLYLRSGHSPLFANDPRAEARLLHHLAGSGLAPDLHDTCDTPLGPVLIYRHVPGRTWRRGAADMARLLARLHRQPPPAGLPHAPDGSAALAAQTRRILAHCPAAAAAHLRALEPRGTVPRSGAAALLHGDAVPGNVIRKGRRLTLIDWQCPALGDPVHDLAVFLSPSMQIAYRGAPLDRAAVRAFLGACPDRHVRARLAALAPWFHWRHAAHCLWRLTRNMAADPDARIGPKAGLMAELHALGAP